MGEEEEEEEEGEEWGEEEEEEEEEEERKVDHIKHNVSSDMWYCVTFNELADQLVDVCNASRLFDLLKSLLIRLRGERVRGQRSEVRETLARELRGERVRGRGDISKRTEKREGQR